MLEDFQGAVSQDEGVPVTRRGAKQNAGAGAIINVDLASDGQLFSPTGSMQLEFISWVCVLCTLAISYLHAGIPSLQGQCEHARM